MDTTNDCTYLQVPIEQEKTVRIKYQHNTLGITLKQHITHKHTHTYAYTRYLGFKNYNYYNSVAVEI